MTEWSRKLAALFRRDEIDAEIEEEMRTHLEMKGADLGDPQQARRQFGNMTQLREDSRAAWGWPRMESWLRDFRYALRGLGRQPGFGAAVVLTLTLGIGASSTIFSLVDTVLLRPLPYPDPERLVAIEEAKSDDESSRTPVAPGRLEDWQRLNQSFEALAGSYADTLTDTTGEVPERLSSAYVSPGFFTVLGTAPALGRVFTEEEERFGGSLAVVISDSFWRRRFAANPRVAGNSLVLADRSYVIVGVMPPSFQYPTPGTELWAPQQAERGLLEIREARFYNCIGRLKQGVTMEQARADLAAVQIRLGELYPKTDAGWTVAMQPLRERLVGKARLALWLLTGSVSLLLLIACANVACLLLARLNNRAAEIATRYSLGAGRAAIARQLFLEGLSYAFVGGVLGMGAAFAGMDVLRKQLPEVPRIGELGVDLRMLALGVGISFLAAVLFSLAPILQTFRRDLRGALTAGGRTLAGSRQRLPRILVSVQLALATALLIGAGLLVRSLVRLQDAPLGFRAENVLTLHVGASRNEPPDESVQRHQRTLELISSVPGVTAVAMSAGLPGVDSTWPREFEIQGERTPDGSLRFANRRVVTAGYFQTLGIPILEGQSCRMSTGTQQAFESLVNRRFAERYFAGRNPIGQVIIGGPQGAPTRVVGVVADVREDGAGVDPQPLIYVCGFLRYWPDSDFLIQTRDPAGLAGAVQQVIRESEPSRPVYGVQPLTVALRGSLSQTRFRTLLLSFFSVMALVLAAVGLYGVMAYMVSQRRREIGIRVALGARPAQIVGEVLRSGGLLAGVGAVAGVLIAAATAWMLRSLLYGVEASDLASYVAAMALLFGVALLACWIPGRRASSIDPTEALREQ